MSTCDPYRKYVQGLNLREVVRFKITDRTLNRWVSKSSISYLRLHGQVTGRVINPSISHGREDPVEEPRMAVEVGVSCEKWDNIATNALLFAMVDYKDLILPWNADKPENKYQWWRIWANEN